MLDFQIRTGRYWRPAYKVHPSALQRLRRFLRRRLSSRRIKVTRLYLP